MKKNPEKNFETIQVDPLSGNYYVIIPEWIVNELSWYEDTKVLLDLEGDELILKEYTDD